MNETRFWVLIKDGVVENSIVWDGVSNWSPPTGYEVVETTAMENAPGPGWLYADGVFTQPAIPEPVEPTPVTE
jgi:hypothetical protein